MSIKWKIILILFLIGFSAIALYPPQSKLKPGIDLAGGTSLLYQIDTSGMQDFEKRFVAQEMIRIQRQRVDPGSKKNLVWRVQGRDRIEIQMPLATEETRARREAYEQARASLERQNLDLRLVRRALIRPSDMSRADYQAKRNEAFARLVDGSDVRQGLLRELAEADNTFQQAEQRAAEARRQRDQLQEDLADADVAVSQLDWVVRNWNEWDEPNRVARVQEVVGDDPARREQVRAYVLARKQLAEARADLLGPEGAEGHRADALRALETANIDIDRLEKFLGARSLAQREEEIARIKAEHPDLVDRVDDLVAAYDAYQMVAGRLDDPEDLKRLLQGSGVLEFRIIPTVDEPDDVISDAEIRRYRELLATVGPNPNRPGYERYSWRKIRSIEDFKVGNAIVEEFAGEYYVLASNQPGEVLLHEREEGGWRLRNARMGPDQIGNWAVYFELNDVGANRFLELTKNNVQRHLCIFLDDQAISAPVLQSPIHKSGQITGNFSQQEVRDLVDKLNAGSLPARLADQPMSVYTVGPTMGRDNLHAGLVAGVVGLIVVAVFMVGYYWFAGSLADLALGLNMLFILATMAFSRSTFTMPGIAGLILTIGMAVDANVLIFERIREEQERGSSVAMAIKNGYGRAFRTIFDANLTTFITGLILWVLASEEVKGFALTLMIGIVSSMFTALFVTRTVFDLLTNNRILKKQLHMFRLFKEPKANWMGMRYAFWAVSAVLVVAGWATFVTRHLSSNRPYSIEFDGGTSIQVILNEAAGDMDRSGVEAALRRVGEEMGNPKIAAARVQQIGDPAERKFEIMTTETNRAEVTLAGDAGLSAAALLDKVKASAQESGDVRLAESTIRRGAEAGRFILTTGQIDQARLRRELEAADLGVTIQDISTQEVVSDAVRQALAGDLDVQDNLEPTLAGQVEIDDDVVADKPELLEYIGGVYLTFEFGHDKTDTLARLRERFEQTRFKEEFNQYGHYDFAVFAPDMAQVADDAPLGGVAVAVAPDDILTGDEFDRFAADQVEKFSQALQLRTSLPRVSQVDPSVGKKSMVQAWIAIVVSLLAIIAYIWLRFGNFRFGIAAVVALVHDVSISLGLVAASAWLAETPLGKWLLISDFKIDLPMIAAFLTVIGYSLNDTIVVFDRVRENRGKLARLTSDTINASINQTLSRTVLTSLTTLLVLLVMYIWGGPGLRGFNYVLIIGVVVGTYSSVGIATPLLIGARAEADKKSSAGGNSGN